MKPYNLESLYVRDTVSQCLAMICCDPSKKFVTALGAGRVTFLKPPRVRVIGLVSFIGLLCRRYRQL